MIKVAQKILKPARKYFDKNLDVTSWEKLEEIYQSLLATEINSAEELIAFMEKVSEMDAIIDEEMAWRYITMTRFADNDKNEKAFNDFYANIVSKIKPYTFKIQKKFYNSPFRKELTEPMYKHLNKIISNEIELFREDNIPLEVKQQELANKYGSIYSKLIFINNACIFIEYLNSNISGDVDVYIDPDTGEFVVTDYLQKYTPEIFQGKTNTISAGFNIGF